MTSGVIRRSPKIACFLVNNLRGKKMGEKWRFFIRQTVFALICTILLRFSWNLRFWLEMTENLFDILFLNVQIIFLKILFSRRSETKNISDEKKIHFDVKKVFWKNRNFSPIFYPSDYWPKNRLFLATF